MSPHTRVRGAGACQRWNMQQGIVRAETKAKEQEDIKGKGQRARRLKSGDWQWEVRSTKYGYETGTPGAKDSQCKYERDGSEGS
jgi:hypothetical protein